MAEYKKPEVDINYTVAGMPIIPQFQRGRILKAINRLSRSRVRDPAYDGVTAPLDLVIQSIFTENPQVLSEALPIFYRLLETSGVNLNDTTKTRRIASAAFGSMYLLLESAGFSPDFIEPTPEPEMLREVKPKKRRGLLGTLSGSKRREERALYEATIEDLKARLQIAEARSEAALNELARSTKCATPLEYTLGTDSE